MARHYALLSHNVHPLARAEFDRGAAPESLPMERMLMVLSHTDQQKSDLDNLLKAQLDPSSPQFHKWLTPQQFGARFGPADADLQAITGWLRSQGFTVGKVSNGKTVIEFSGTAGQVKQAFHTEIHNYVVNGEAHWANATDPQIPEALAPAVAGVATLHNFLKKTQLVDFGQKFTAKLNAQGKPEFTSSNGEHALAPGREQPILQTVSIFPRSTSSITALHPS